MDILTGAVVNHQPAVVVQLGKRIALLLHQPLQQTAAHKAQIPGQNHVIVLRTGVGVGKVLAERLCRRRSHRSPHVVDVGDAKVCHGTDGHRSHIGCLTLGSDHAGPGAGHRPLGGRSSLTAIFERKTELPLRRAEMGGGSGNTVSGKPCLHKQRCQRQAFRHGRASPVQSEKGNLHLSGSVCGTDALVEQVSGK